MLPGSFWLATLPTLANQSRLKREPFQVRAFIANKHFGQKSILATVRFSLR